MRRGNTQSKGLTKVTNNSTRQIVIKKSLPVTTHTIFMRSTNRSVKPVQMNQIKTAPPTKKCSFCGGGRR